MFQWYHLDFGIAVLVVLSIVFQKRVASAYDRVRERIGRVLASLQEGITGVRVVQAFTRERPQDKVTARTAGDGRVRLLLARPGEWLAKAVHMIENTDTEDVEWESYWASLTFRLDAPRRAAD